MYYVIKVLDREIYWSGKDWSGPAKKYKSRLLAENACKKTRSPLFDKYQKEVVEIIPVLFPG